MGACLSLTGPYARFGTQAAAALQAWRDLDGDVEVLIEDDGGDPARVAAELRILAGRCDLLLGPYSTGLMRTAVRVAAETGLLLWNHGGAGDDVQTAAPGHVVSVLTPASRYAEPFVRLLAALRPRAPLRIVAGPGGFGRQVAAGAERAAREAGVATAGEPQVDEWDLLCAGSFEEDVAAVRDARALASPPRTLCAVAAGVRDFGEAVARPAGILGIGQWYPGLSPAPDIGPAEDDLMFAYMRRAGFPDYPAVQAAAAASIAVHCARTACAVDRESLWAAAAALDGTTLFGPFRIDPHSGMQLGHGSVLVRWSRDGPTLTAS